MIRLSEALSRLSDHAKMDNRPDPVITTDRDSARFIMRLIEEDIGGDLSLGSRPRDWTPGVMGMFDGIKIVAGSRQICKHEVDGWREHFGLLADIWR